MVPCINSLDTLKEDVNRYLINNNIIDHPLLVINENCYNFRPNNDIFCKYHPNLDIKCMYFPKGERGYGGEYGGMFDVSQAIDLDTQSDKVYLFKMNPKIQQEKFFRKQKDQQDQYQQDLQKWKDQCYFKPGVNYRGYEVRDKLGRKNNRIYSYESGRISDVLPFPEDPVFGCSFDFEYTTGWIVDDMCFIPIGRSERFEFGWFFLIEFNTYFDTTKPPLPPSNN